MESVRFSLGGRATAHTDQCTWPRPPSGWGGHMTAPQLSRDPGQKDWKVLLCMHIFPLVDGQFPQVSLIFELEYEDIAF